MPTTPIARSRAQWWSRSRPRCSIPSADSSSSKTPSWSPTPDSRFTARAVAAGTAAAPRCGELAKRTDSLNAVVPARAPRDSKSAFTRVHSPYLKGVYARLRGRERPSGRAMRGDEDERCDAGVRAELNAQREQRDCADPYDQDDQGHRVVVEPMPALYTHDAPRPDRPTHSSPGSHIEGRRGFTSLLVADGGSEVQTCGSSELTPPETWRRPARDHRRMWPIT